MSENLSSPIKLPLAVDVDKPETWPPAVAEWAAKEADDLRGSTEFTSDLDGTLIERENEFRELFGGRKLLAYHASRLLDEDITAIREHGLQRLSPELVARRIDLAERLDHLSADDASELRQSNAFAIENHVGREDLVCMILGRETLDRDPYGVNPLLGTWGGEAIHGGPLPDRDDNVRPFGTPTIVVARFGLGGGTDRVRTGPSVPKLFVGRLLGLEDISADVFLHDDVPPEDILGFWQPGDPDYDRHQELERT